MLTRIKLKSFWKKITTSFHKNLSLNEGEWAVWSWKHEEMVFNGNLRNISFNASGGIINAADGQLRLDIYYIDGTKDEYLKRLDYAGGGNVSRGSFEGISKKDKPIQKIWYEVGFKKFSGNVWLDITLNSYEVKGSFKL